MRACMPWEGWHRLGAWVRLGQACADVQVLSCVVWARVLNNGMACLKRRRGAGDA